MMNSEKFPKNWAEGYIYPIYKNKGEKTDPSNYRGITIASCLGKFFTKMMNHRFMEFLEVHNIIQNNQIGFTRNKRTSDHVFVLKSLMDLAKFKKYPL